MDLRFRKRHKAPGVSTTTGEHCAPVHVSGKRGSRLTPILPGTGRSHAGKSRRVKPSRSALAALLAVVLAGLLLLLLLNGLA
jgi:hypothetical protein